MNPDPHTLRELLWMSYGRQSEGWTHTSHLMAMMANMLRGEGDEAAHPADFKPEAFGGTPVRPKPKLSVDAMIATFCN